VRNAPEDSRRRARRVWNCFFRYALYCAFSSRKRFAASLSLALRSALSRIARSRCFLKEQNPHTQSGRCMSQARGSLCRGHKHDSSPHNKRRSETTTTHGTYRRRRAVSARMRRSRLAASDGCSRACAAYDVPPVFRAYVLQQHTPHGHGTDSTPHRRVPTFWEHQPNPPRSMQRLHLMSRLLLVLTRECVSSGAAHIETPLALRQCSCCNKSRFANQMGKHCEL